MTRSYKQAGYKLALSRAGISGDFIRRLTYPDAEISVNTDNLNAAVARMGPDNLDTPVWWDQ